MHPYGAYPSILLNYSSNVNRLIIVIVLILYCLIGIEITRVRDEFKLSDDDRIALTSGNSSNSVATTTTEANSRVKPGFTPESTMTSDTREQITFQRQPTSRNTTPGYQTPKQRRVSLRQYVIMPSLFFLAMLATWIAPSINRISEFVHHKHGNYSLLLSVSTLGSLRGFWNGVIFITIGMKGWKRRASGRRMALRQVRLSFLPWLCYYLGSC
jgi:hypothetical protein